MADVPVDLTGYISYLNARMLASVLGQMMTLAPPPLMCPACGTTRDACLRRFGRDRCHDEQIRAALRSLP